MNYVYDEEADRRLTTIIGSLTDELVEELNPKAIFLTGSLGRGEGAVEVAGESLRSISDCELVILPLTLKTNQTAEQVIARYTEQYDIDIDISGVVKSVQLLTPLSRLMRPTIDNYDLRYGSKLLYGNNYRKSMPSFNPSEIPPWEGFRLVFNRLAKLLTSGIIRDYWLDKLVLALRDAILLSKGWYSPSYDYRQQLFEEKDAVEFAVSPEVYRYLRQLGRGATDRRQNCSLKKWSNKQIDQLIAILERVLIKLAHVHFNRHPSGFQSFKREFLESSLTQEYNRFPGQNSLIQNGLSSSKHIFESGRIPRFGSVMTNWSHDIYTTMPIAFADRSGSESSKVLREETKSTVARYHPSPKSETSVHAALQTCWQRYCW